MLHGICVPVVQRHRAVSRRRNAPAQLKLDPAGAQLVQRIGAQIRAQFRQDAVARVNQHKACVLRAEILVIAPHARHQVKEFGNRLRAREPAAGHHKRQPPLARRGIRLSVGAFQLRQHPVAQRHGVFQGLQRDRVLRQSRQPVEVRHRPHGQHQVVIGHRLRRRRAAAAHQHLPRLGVDPGHVAVDEVGIRTSRANRRRDVLGLQRAGGHLRQHRCKEQEVALADQRDLQVMPSPRHALQRLRRAHAAESAAQHHDAMYGTRRALV